MNIFRFKEKFNLVKPVSEPLHSLIKQEYLIILLAAKD